MTIVDFPQQLRGPFIGPNTIIRSSSAVFYWGYPTSIQNSALTMALATFDFLGIGAYFLYFKGSNSKWWKKVLKFLVALLLYTLIASATNFHYFDFPEFVAPILFFILWLFVVTRKGTPLDSDRKEIVPVKMEQKNISADAFSETSIQNVEMELCNPGSSNENKLVDYDKEEHVNSSTAQNDSELSTGRMQFCRYCGKQIESDSTYCKHCGCTQIKNDKLYTKQLKPIFLIWSKIKPFGGILGQLFVNKDRIKDRLFIFSKPYKVILIGITMICAITAIIYCYIFKYERWLYSDFHMTIIGACASILIVIITWIMCHKQQQMYVKWKIFLIYILLCLSSIIALGSFVCMVDILFSNQLKWAKEKAIHHECLTSNNPKVLNDELNRRFEEYWDRVDEYSSLSNLIKRDEEYFDIIQIESDKNNGVAQGILGDYYYSISYRQINDSKNEYGYISDDNLYTKGRDNLERAFYWWKKASENDDARGLYRMGNCYACVTEIEGISKDLNIAYQYWTKASEKGYGMAYKRLGDLFGTWNYLDAVYFDISNDSIKGVDNLGADDNPSFSKPYPLPTEWKHDISIARSYWEKAVECGGHASEEAKKCLEKVYPEEKR